jgi:hypothetical protein
VVEQLATSRLLVRLERPGDAGRRAAVEAHGPRWATPVSQLHHGPDTTRA